MLEKAAMAPSLTERDRPLSAIPESPATRFRSITWSGTTKRMFSIGISDWPPASSLALSRLPSRVTASATVLGSWY